MGHKLSATAEKHYRRRPLDLLRQLLPLKGKDLKGHFSAFSRMINARAAISSEMALRIEAWLGKERGGVQCKNLAGLSSQLKQLSVNFKNSFAY